MVAYKLRPHCSLNRSSQWFIIAVLTFGAANVSSVCCLVSVTGDGHAAGITAHAPHILKIKCFPGITTVRLFQRTFVKFSN